MVKQKKLNVYLGNLDMSLKDKLIKVVKLRYTNLKTNKVIMQLGLLII